MVASFQLRPPSEALNSGLPGPRCWERLPSPWIGAKLREESHVHRWYFSLRDDKSPSQALERQSFALRTPLASASLAYLWDMAQRAACWSRARSSIRHSRIPAEDGVASNPLKPKHPEAIRSSSPKRITEPLKDPETGKLGLQKLGSFRVFAAS